MKPHMDPDSQEAAIREERDAWPFKPPRADLRSIAAQRGLIIENQPHELGSVLLKGEETLGTSREGEICGAVNRDCWITRLILSGELQHVQVTTITVAGIPLDLGASTGMPAEAFSRDSSVGISFGRRLVRQGQSVHIQLRYMGTTGAQVTGSLLCDVLAPHIQAEVQAEISSIIGWAPVYRDASGALYVDPDGLRLDLDSLNPGEPPGFSDLKK